MSDHQHSHTMKGSSNGGLGGYLTKIYTMHIIFFAIPLLVIGIRGSLKKNITAFEFAYIFLLGGMALVYHLFWFAQSFASDSVFPENEVSYLRAIYLFHIIVVALPLIYFGIRGQKNHRLEPFAYTYFTLLGGMALVYHGYWLYDILSGGRISY